MHHRTKYRIIVCADVPGNEAIQTGAMPISAVCNLATETAPLFCLSPISPFVNVGRFKSCSGRKQMLLEGSSFVVIGNFSGKERFAAAGWAVRSPYVRLPSLHESARGGRNRSILPFLLIASASTGTAQETQSSRDTDNKEDARVVRVHTIKQFEEALSGAKSKLVVVEYAASHSINSKRIYPSMVELSQTCQDVIFLLVMGDESDETKELCSRAGVENVPHFIFYKSREVIHEEKGILPDQLVGDVLYYGDTDAPIQFLHSRKDVEALLAKHAEDSKLIVLDVGLKHCGPCVKIYPTFVKLAKKMRDSTVFARMNGDENEDCMELLKQMGVVEVPTFLFIRDGKLSGRYVGSGKGELIGEVLRYQGVRVTY